MESKIKQKRLKIGMSRAEMARKLEIPLRTLENWETGANSPPAWAEKLVLEKLEKFEKLEK